MTVLIHFAMTTLSCNVDFIKDLERNIKLTPQQRKEEHQKALNLVLELLKAKKVELKRNGRDRVPLRSQFRHLNL